MPPLAIAIVFVSTFMHAGWNLLARERRATDIFWRTLLVTGVVGIGPALATEVLAEPIWPRVGNHLLLAGLFQGLYYLGLTLGYRTGEFTVVYPLARALPVLLVALADLARGQPPSGLGWAGLLLVTAGCLVLPLPSLRGIRWERYWNRAMLWTLVTALGTVGYSIVDSAAAQRLPRGVDTALRYGVLEAVLSLVFYGLLLRLLRLPAGAPGQPASWRRSLLIGMLIFSAYGLVLWAYQLSPHASYVVAMRQFSIVLGVIAGSLLLREGTPALRIAAALTITAGTVCIAVAR